MTPAWFEILESLLKALFVYNANPALLKIIVYPSLLLINGLESIKLWNKNSRLSVGLSKSPIKLAFLELPKD
ncbi:MAG: hypothetical protein ACXABO_18320 [Promethearchaeota archaeon]